MMEATAWLGDFVEAEIRPDGIEFTKVPAMLVIRGGFKQKLGINTSLLFHKPKIRTTANDLKFRFSFESPTYSITIDVLKSLWE